MNNILSESYLICKYDTRSSFYNKAIIKTYAGGVIELYSYNTLVLTIDKNNNTYELNYNIASYLLFSNTTLRHIKEALKQFLYCNDIKLTKNDIINNANN